MFGFPFTNTDKAHQNEAPTRVSGFFASNTTFIFFHNCQFQNFQLAVLDPLLKELRRRNQRVLLYLLELKKQKERKKRKKVSGIF